MNEKKLKLREEALKILLKNFGDEFNNKLIYECADEWSKEQPISNGVVAYYKAYYNN